jgi:Asp-tRNA(Asn)/Glu-tRNA(Gln) amidotransferase A subunit family amidase
MKLNPCSLSLVAIFCGTWTGLQAPSLNVPGFAGEVSIFIWIYCCTETPQTGMPIGLSLVSGRYRDQKLVAVVKEVAKVFKGVHAGQIRELPGAPSSLL